MTIVDLSELAVCDESSLQSVNFGGWLCGVVCGGNYCGIVCWD